MDNIRARQEFVHSLNKRSKDDKINIFGYIASEYKDLAIAKDDIFNMEGAENTFYNYAPLRKEVLQNITEGKIHLTNPKSFNDPYDSRAMVLKFKKILNHQDIASFMMDHYPKLKGYWENLNRKEKKNFSTNSKTLTDLERTLKRTFDISNDTKIFSENCDPNNKLAVMGHEDPMVGCFSACYNNILMWSHYAKNHQGICIGYSYEEHKDLLHPISYQEAFATHPDQAILIKHIGWSYEKEWRIVITKALRKILNEDSLVENDYSVIGGFNVRSICFGAKFSDSLEGEDKDAKDNREWANEIFSFIENNDIDSYAINMAKDKFVLDKIKINSPREYFDQKIRTNKNQK